MKSCIHFLKREFYFIDSIDKDVLVDKEFARLAVDERVDMKHLGLNEDLDVEHLRTLREINNYVDDILRKYQYDRDEARLFIYHYLSFRLQDKVNLRTALRNVSNVGIVTKKTNFKSPVPNRLVGSFLGGNSRRKKQKIRTRRVKYLST